MTADQDLLGDDAETQWPTGPTVAMALVAAVLIRPRLRYPRAVAAATIVACEPPGR